MAGVLFILFFLNGKSHYGSYHCMENKKGNDGPQSRTVQEFGTCLLQNMALTVRSGRDELLKLFVYMIIVTAHTNTVVS